MKTIVIGCSSSGKTTLASRLPSSIDINEEYSDNIPKVIDETLAKKDALFFINTDYITLEDLRKAKSLGFNIVQLELTLPELQKRNTNPDLNQWLEDMIEYQNELKRVGLVDKSLDATLPVEKLVKLL
jgi:shikimate kinase